MCKVKICKGIGKAVGYGCGGVIEYAERGISKMYFSRYGLGTKGCTCYYDWLKTSEEGKKLFTKTSKKVKMQEAAERKREIKNKLKTSRIEQMSLTTYWTKVSQPIFNEIARLIDFGYPCISSGNYTNQVHGGHYHSVGSNKTISLNLWNIHLQSLQANTFKHSDAINYREGLIKRYGIDCMDFIDNLSKCPVIHITKEILIEKTKIAQEIRNGLKKEEMRLKPVSKLIMLRNLINEKLGLYNTEFSQFKQ